MTVSRDAQLDAAGCPGEPGARWESGEPWPIPVQKPLETASLDLFHCRGGGILAIAQTRSSARVSCRGFLRFLPRFLADIPAAPGRGLVQVPGSPGALQLPVDHRTIFCGVQIKQARGSGPTPLF